MAAIDILFLTLSVCIALFTIFICVTLVYLISILRDVVRVTDKAEAIVDKVDQYITKPLLMTKAIVDFVGPFISAAEDKLSPKKKK